MIISKSDYITFRKHPAWLWLKKHRPDLLPKPDHNSVANMEQGKAFESIAETIFPNAIYLNRKEFTSIDDWANKTKQLIEKGAETILQGAFVYEGFLCIADALTLTPEGYVLTEIKATTSPEKKKEYICDLAFQKVVIENNGIDIVKTRVLHANKDYIRHGDILIDQLLCFYDTTDKVIKETTLSVLKMKEAKQVIQMSEIPNDSIRFAELGSASKWRTIYRKLHPELTPFSIYDLASCKGKGMNKIIAALEDANIKQITDIPLSINLRDNQIDQVNVTRLRKPVISSRALKEFIDQIKFPIYFLDYESINPIVPVFDYTWPCQQVVFQYSIHIMHVDGTLDHKEYLHADNTNPGPLIIESLEKHIAAEGSIIVWHATFETGRHVDLAKLYPVKAEFLLGLNDRVIDLEIPFAKRIYQDMNLMGRSTIKKVLPLLCPDTISYKSLEIQEGSTASRSWREAVVDGTRDDKDLVLENLRKYCGLDTLAMVEIYKKLIEISQ